MSQVDQRQFEVVSEGPMRTLAEDLETISHELRMQALARHRQVDENGLFNLDISSIVSFDQTTEVETAEVPCNKIKTMLRCCFTNEIKSARELKVYLKGDYPLYFPMVCFNMNPVMNPSRLDMRSKKPVRNPMLQDGQEQGLLQPGMQLVETGF